MSNFRHARFHALLASLFFVRTLFPNHFAHFSHCLLNYGIKTFIFFRAATIAANVQRIPEYYLENVPIKRRKEMCECSLFFFDVTEMTFKSIDVPNGTIVIKCCLFLVQRLWRAHC